MWNKVKEKTQGKLALWNLGEKLRVIKGAHHHYELMPLSMVIDYVWST